MDLNTLQSHAWQIAEDKGQHDHLRSSVSDERSSALAGLVVVYAAIGAIAQEVKRHGVVNRGLLYILTAVVKDAINSWLYHDRQPTTGKDYATQIRLILTHTEVSEASAVADDPTMLADELADILIRIGDLAQERGINLSQAVIKKMEYNMGRPYAYGTPWEQSRKVESA